MTNRLASEIISIVHYVQVGFIPTREARDGVRWDIDIIHAAKSNSSIQLLMYNATLHGRRKGFRQGELALYECHVALS